MDTSDRGGWGDIGPRRATKEMLLFLFFSFVGNDGGSKTFSLFVHMPLLLPRGLVPVHGGGDHDEQDGADCDEEEKYK